MTEYNDTIALKLEKAKKSEEKIELLQRRLDTHIGRYNEKSTQQDEKLDKIIESQNQNKKQIEQLMNCTKELQSSTRDIIDAWYTGTSVVKAGSLLGKFVKWSVGIAVIGTAVSWIFNQKM